MASYRHRTGVRTVLASVFTMMLVVVSGTALRLGEPGPGTQSQESGTLANAVTVIAVSRTDQFAGAVGEASTLFVGSLNGTVAKMDATTGHILGSVRLPDGNSAAHLTYYNGSLYVGTEWLIRARDQPPFHIYRIDPSTMKIAAQIPMESHFANGFVLAFNGFLWAGDGHCTLYKIDPNRMLVLGTIPEVAEDEMAFDGTHYWAECMSTVNVLIPGAGFPVPVASGSLSYPERPRGFFMIDNGIYTSGTLDFTIYSMSLAGRSVIFRSVVPKGDESTPTRDTVEFGGLIYAYETSPRADLGQLPARIYEYSRTLHLLSVVTLPGPALGVDASQHSLFTLDGKLYFVTESSVGHIELTQGSNNSTTVGSSTPTTSVSTVGPNYRNDDNVPRIETAA